jgi:hypothetical protein
LVGCLVAWAITFFVASSLDVAHTASAAACCRLDYAIAGHRSLDRADVSRRRHLLTWPGSEWESQHLVLDIHVDQWPAAPGR